MNDWDQGQLELAMDRFVLAAERLIATLTTYFESLKARIDQ